MTSFIVVEDDPKTQELIKEVLRKVLISKDINIEVKYFTKYTKELRKIIVDDSIRKVYIYGYRIRNKDKWH